LLGKKERELTDGRSHWFPSVTLKKYIRTYSKEPKPEGKKRLNADIFLPNKRKGKKGKGFRIRKSGVDQNERFPMLH